jgi:hypothetical protein
MELFEDYYDESEALASVNTEVSKNLSTLVRQLRDVENKIEDTENRMKALKAEKHKLSIDTIPALMDEMGVERLDVDGLTVSRKMMIHASIPVARREEAYAWLRENRCDDIIKNVISCSFGKGQDNLAGDVIGLLETKGFHPEQKTSIHPSTLKAFVKERITEGKPIDLDMFGAFIANAAEIRRK